MAFLNINKVQNKNIVRKIDQSDYMKLGKPTSRLDLFDFAMALGVRQGSPDIDTPLSNIFPSSISNYIRYSIKRYLRIIRMNLFVCFSF